MENKHLTLGGIFIGLHLLLMILSKFLIGSEIILIIFLPLLSALYFLKTGFKETLLYIFTTLIICFLFDYLSTLVYILPALFVGSFYGFLVKNKFKQLEIVYLTTIMHFITLVISFSFLAYLFSFPIVDIIRDAFSFFNPFLPITIILIALAFIQSFATHLVISKELSRFEYKIEKEEKTPTWFLVAIVLFALIFSFLKYLDNEFSIVLMIFIIMFSVPYIVQGALNVKNKVFTYIGFIITSFLFIFLLGFFPLVYFPLLILFLFSPFVVNVEF